MPTEYGESLVSELKEEISESKNTNSKAEREAFIVEGC